jgi:hypothetical protein
MVSAPSRKTIVSIELQEGVKGCKSTVEDMCLGGASMSNQAVLASTGPRSHVTVFEPDKVVLLSIRSIRCWQSCRLVKENP